MNLRWVWNPPDPALRNCRLFDGGNYLAAAEAVQHDTSVVIVPRERFQALMLAHPEIAVQALRALAVRMRKQVKMIEVHALHTVRARVASYLVRVSDGRVVFRLDETNEEIAGHIGSVRDVVSRTLSSLREAELIHISGRTITVLDRSGLVLAATSEDSR